MAENPTIRVLEIRKANNGYVVTAFDQERGWHRGDGHKYRSWVATSPKILTALVETIVRSQTWAEAVDIPPAQAIEN